jgi:hypothetical protein
VSSLLIMKQTTSRIVAVVADILDSQSLVGYHIVTLIEVIQVLVLLLQLELRTLAIRSLA